MSNKKAFHIVVYGKVQGVGFRYFVREKALEYHLTGWVKNCTNGNVEIEVEGYSDELEIFIDFLKIGNSYSRIAKVSVEEISPLRNFTSFQIKY